MNMQRILLKLVSLSSVVFASIGFSFFAFAQTSPAAVVYKHTDENGRVTYSNSPRKGAVVVDLPTLTVMSGVASRTAQPTQPAQSAQPANVDVAKAKPAPPANIDLPTQPSEAREAQPSAPIPTFSTPSPSTPVSAIKPSAAAGVGAATMAQQRREDVRRRILEGEIEAEDQLLIEARDMLNAEQARSPAMRALRASLPNEARPSDTTKESRALVERHFARVRDLQDQLVMHEQNLVGLREMLSTVASAASPLKPRTQPASPNASAAQVTQSTKTSQPSQALPKVAIVTTKRPSPPPSVTASKPNSAASVAADETSMTATSLPIVKLKPPTPMPVAVTNMASATKRTMAEDR